MQPNCPFQPKQTHSNPLIRQFESRKSEKKSAKSIEFSVYVTVAPRSKKKLHLREYSNHKTKAMSHNVWWTHTIQNWACYSMPLTIHTIMGHCDMHGIVIRRVFSDDFQPIKFLFSMFRLFSTTTEFWLFSPAFTSTQNIVPLDHIQMIVEWKKITRGELMNRTERTFYTCKKIE